MQEVFEALNHEAAHNLLDAFTAEITEISESFKNEDPREIFRALSDNVEFEVHVEEWRFKDDVPREIATLSSHWTSKTNKSMFTGECACVDVENGKVLVSDEWGMYKEQM